ncbi:MAG: PP2C family protein-serine/threonine phosphatase [Gammaproteobacteria bacterium]
MDEPPLLIWTSASACHIGKVRKVNEDACLDMPELGLWAVADGMGGHQAGDFASKTVVEHLLLLGLAADLNSFVQQIRTQLEVANGVIRAESIRRNQPVGSTVAVLAAYGYTAACIWAGDSRIYRQRGGLLERLTQDHSLVAPETGAYAQEYAGNNVITRAVGPEDELNLDMNFTELRHGDTFLLCTDGLYKELEEDELAAMLSQQCTSENNAHQEGAEEKVRALVDAALAHGGHDNLSAVVVKFFSAF